MSNRKSRPSMVRVTLKKPHTHAGRAHEKGDTIDVEEGRIPWLVQQRVIAKPTPAGKSTPKRPEASDG